MGGADQGSDDVSSSSEAADPGATCEGVCELPRGPVVGWGAIWPCEASEGLRQAP
jgi:hypothetical protein